MGEQGLGAINQPLSLILIFLAAIFHGERKTLVLISHQPSNPSGLFQNPTLKCMFSVPASLYRPQIRTFPRWTPGYRLLQPREFPLGKLRFPRSPWALGGTVWSCVSGRNKTPGDSRCKVTLLIWDALLSGTLLALLIKQALSLCLCLP